MAAMGHRTATSTNARVHIEPPHLCGVHFLGQSGASSGVCAARYFGREVIRRRPPWGRGPSQGPPESLGNGWRCARRAHRILSLIAGFGHITVTGPTVHTHFLYSLYSREHAESARYM